LGLVDHGARHGTLAFSLEEGVGVVPCAVEIEGEGRGNAVFTLPRLPQRLGPAPSATVLAAALDLDVTDIGFDNHQPARYSAGVPYTLVPVASRAAVDKARPRLGHWAEAFEDDETSPPFIYCREPIEPTHAFYGRMFAPRAGIPEDPATGSAVAAFAGAVLAYDQPVDGEHTLVVEQGYAMGRQSQIRLTMTVSDGALVRAAIGGQAVVISEGSLNL
jgi:trans-2,3-dihydro-3-hydroxyanthranilate isomerase